MQTPHAVIVGSLAALLLLSANALAQTSYPMITHTTPVAVQRGKTTEITVEGQMNFAGVYKALFEGAGLSAETIAPVAGKDNPVQKAPLRSVKLKLTVSADA